MCLLLAPAGACGQDTDYLFYEKVGHGTEVSATICIMRDTQGMMWMGTNKGLFCYDGYTLQPHFTYGEKSNTNVYCGVVEDSTRFYLGTENGLIVYNYRKDAYEDTGADFPPDIRAMAGSGGTLWLGTLNGLYAYNPSSRTLARIGGKLPHQAVYSLACATDGYLYIGTYNGLCRLGPRKKETEAIPLPVSGNKSNMFVNSLLEDTGRHCVWIGTESGLFRYFPASGRVEETDGLRDNSVKSLALDMKGRLLAGTDNGLYIYKEGEDARHVINDTRNPHSLPNNIIWTIYADEENVWLGTDYGTALARVGNVSRYIPVSQITGVGEGNQFYSMLRDGKGDLWLGGTNGLIRSPKTGGKDVAWYKMGNSEFPLAHNRVRKLYEDRDGNLWVASDGSVGRYDGKSGQFVFYNIVDSTGRYNANWAYDLMEDNDGRLWIATCRGGIFVVNRRSLMSARAGETYVADKNYSTLNGLSGMFSHALSLDRKGNVWAIFYNSPCNIEKINPSSGRVTHVARQVRCPNTPCCILCARDGRMWTGLYGGLMVIDPKDNSVENWTFISTESCEILSMIEAEGHIWIATTDGLWATDEKKLRPRRIPVADGSFTSLFYDAREHKMYMGTANGYAEAPVGALLKDRGERQVIPTALYVNNKPFPLPQSIRYTTRLTLSHDQNNITLDVSDLPYSREEKSRVLYRLDKTEKEWNSLPPNTNRITYNNLKYGRYRLLVTVLDAGGNPSEKSCTLDIRIRPPFYYSPAAECLYAAVLLVLAVWAVRFVRMRRRLKREREEKEKVLEQTRAKIEYFTNLSHDLKTPLSMIIAPVNRLLSRTGDEGERQQLELVQRNAMKLSSLIRQGLDFSQMDAGAGAVLVPAYVELVAFARNIFSAYARGVVKDKGVNARFETGEDRIFVWADAVKLESVLDNLLSNAVKFTPGGGTVKLSLKLSGGQAEITVADTGVGIPEQDLPHVFQRFFQSSRTAGRHEGTGIGLYLVRTYTELHGGRVEISSRENGGTAVTVFLPAADTGKDVAENRTGEAGEKAPEGAPLLLVVEDNGDVAGFLRRILGGKYRVAVAENGREGLEKATSLLPDLIVSDIRMPVMDGMEMVRRIKKQVPTSTIPVILLTAQSDTKTELESLHLRTDAFIAKPFEPELLLLRVEQLLRAARAYEKKARIEAMKEPGETTPESYDEKFLGNVIGIIEGHISDSDFNVNSLCEMAAVSNKQMYRKINQLTGMTPVAFIRSIRMKKAAMLLKTKKFSVAEVMYLVGFSNHSYFSKCFSEEFGVLPKQYAG